jgi:hypothetical protein
MLNIICIGCILLYINIPLIHFSHGFGIHQAAVLINVINIIMNNKPLNYKEPNKPMAMEEATTYLKKIGEWESVWRFDRETILGWANYLKEREKEPITTKKHSSKKTVSSSIN